MGKQTFRLFPPDQGSLLGKPVIGRQLQADLLGPLPPLLQMLKAPFLSGFVLSFLRSVTCLSVVIFLYAPSTTVGTISVMVLVQSGQWGEAAAFTVVLITIAFTVLRLAQWILGRQGIKLEL